MTEYLRPDDQRGLYGGGVTNSGTVTLTDCTISSNFAENGGAASRTPAR